MGHFRLIPVLVMENGRAIKTVRYKRAIYLGDPLQIVKLYSDLTVDELVVVDKSASLTGQPNLSLIENIAAICSVPLTYSGGLSSMDQALRIVNSGVEKLAVNLAMYEDPEFVARLSQTLGAQSVVAAIDFSIKKSGDLVTSHWCRDISRPLLGHMDACQQLGIGEFFLSNSPCDGLSTDLTSGQIEPVLNQSSVPVIFNCGFRSKEMINSAIKCGCDAIAVSTFVSLKTSLGGALVSYSKKGLIGES